MARRAATAPHNLVNVTLAIGQNMVTRFAGKAFCHRARETYPRIFSLSLSLPLSLSLFLSVLPPSLRFRAPAGSLPFLSLSLPGRVHLTAACCGSGCQLDVVEGHLAVRLHPGSQIGQQHLPSHLAVRRDTQRATKTKGPQSPAPCPNPPRGPNRNEMKQRRWLHLPVLFIFANPFSGALLLQGPPDTSGSRGRSSCTSPPPACQ